MKLWTGIVLSATVLFSSESASRPEPFFQAGNEITYSNTTLIKGWGTARDHSILTVESVIEKAESVSSVCMFRYYNEDHKLQNVYRLRFACDSACFYSNATNWLYEPWEEDKEHTYTGDSLCYPLNMKVGDTLRTSNAVLGINSNGVRGTSTTRFANRKVVALDTLQMAIGKIAAYKIEMKVTVTSNTKDPYNGSKKTELEYDVTEWFSPAAGVVRAIHLKKNGDSRILMESYSK